MLKLFVALIFTGVSLARAGTIHQRAASDTTTIANFDQFRCTAPNKLGFEIRQNVRTYQAFFGRMYLLEPGTGNGTVSVGVAPSSGRNVAAYVQSSDPFTVPFITIPPGNTNVTSFDADSLNFGCVRGHGGGSAQGVSVCILEVNGYRNSQKVASQKFSFLPGLVTKAKMTQAQLTTAFRNLERVEFATTYHSSVKEGGATYIDDVKFTAHERA